MIPIKSGQNITRDQFDFVWQVTLTRADTTASLYVILSHYVRIWRMKSKYAPEAISILENFTTFAPEFLLYILWLSNYELRTSSRSKKKPL